MAYNHLSSSFPTASSSLPINLPLKYRRKSLNFSDVEEEVLNPRCHSHTYRAQSSHDANEHSSASSSPIASSAALGSTPSSPTDYARIRYESSPRQDYYYAFNHERDAQDRDHETAWSSRPASKRLLSSTSSSHYAFSSRYRFTSTRPYAPSSFSYSSPSEDSEGHPAPSEFDLDGSAYSEDMDIDIEDEELDPDFFTHERRVSFSTSAERDQPFIRPKPQPIDRPSRALALPKALADPDTTTVEMRRSVVSDGKSGVGDDASSFSIVVKGDMCSPNCEQSSSSPTFASLHSEMLPPSSPPAPSSPLRDPSPSPARRASSPLPPSSPILESSPMMSPSPLPAFSPVLASSSLSKTSPSPLLASAPFTEAHVNPGPSIMADSLAARSPVLLPLLTSTMPEENYTTTRPVEPILEPITLPVVSEFSSTPYPSTHLSTSDYVTASLSNESCSTCPTSSCSASSSSCDSTSRSDSEVSSSCASGSLIGVDGDVKMDSSVPELVEVLHKYEEMLESLPSSPLPVEPSEREQSLAISRLTSIDPEIKPSISTTSSRSPSRSFTVPLESLIDSPPTRSLSILPLPSTPPPPSTRSTSRKPLSIDELLSSPLSPIISDIEESDDDRSPIGDTSDEVPIVRENEMDVDSNFNDDMEDEKLKGNVRGQSEKVKKARKSKSPGSDGEKLAKKRRSKVKDGEERPKKKAKRQDELDGDVELRDDGAGGMKTEAKARSKVPTENPEGVEKVRKKRGRKPKVVPPASEDNSPQCDHSHATSDPSSSTPTSYKPKPSRNHNTHPKSPSNSSIHSLLSSPSARAKLLEEVSAKLPLPLEEFQGMLIEAFATSRASSLPASTLLGTLMESRPVLKDALDESDGDCCGKHPHQRRRKGKERLDEDDVLEEVDERQGNDDKVEGEDDQIKLKVGEDEKRATKMNKREWMKLIEDVLEEGRARCGVFGKVESSFKDDHDHALEAQWFYVPENDADIDRAALIRSMMPRPGKRSETKKYKQYYWRPLGKISRWDPEDAM